MTKTSIKKALQRAAGGAEFATKYDIDDVAARIFDNTEAS